MQQFIKINENDMITTLLQVLLKKQKEFKRKF